MNPRERVLAAVGHREPDRVPVTFGVPGLSSIWDAPPYGYRALCRYLGIADDEEPRIFADSHSVENAHPALLDRFGADLRWVCGGTERAVETLPDGTTRDSWLGLITAQAGLFADVINDRAPLRDATALSDLDAYEYWPGDELIHEPAITRGKADEARMHRERGFAVVAVPGAGCDAIFHTYDFLRGFDMRFIDMYDNPRLFDALAARIVELDIAYLEEFLPPIADSIDFIYMGEDLGSQQAPFMSLEMYRRFCKPHQRAWIDAVRRLAPKTRILFHSCGSVHQFIPDLIEIGVDVLNPIQPKAALMEPWRLKRDFGADISFCGGFDIQELLPFGTPDQIRDGARALVDALAPGGGFIFSPAHQVLPEVRPENIVAMYDAAIEFGHYPIGQANSDGGG
jgi:uroporphyrinogen decarboxylase